MVDGEAVKFAMTGGAVTVVPEEPLLPPHPVRMPMRVMTSRSNAKRGAAKRSGIYLS
jgi:hypothetical protein